MYLLFYLFIIIIYFYLFWFCLFVYQVFVFIHALAHICFNIAMAKKINNRSQRPQRFNSFSVCCTLRTVCDLYCDNYMQHSEEYICMV